MEKVAERIVIKVGTKSITNLDYSVKGYRVDLLAGQMSKEREAGRQIAVVCSGAVSAGMNELGFTNLKLTTQERQLAAIFGQANINYEWVLAFRMRDILAGQLLFSELKYNPELLLDALKHGIPVINGNDATNPRKTRRDHQVADNDEVTKFVAQAVDPSLVIFLTDVGGVKDRYGEVISRIACEDDLRRIDRERSSWVYRGEGGMYPKVLRSLEIAKRGPVVVIANAGEPDVINKITHKEKVGTWIYGG